ncbi:hypothetical protein LZF95_02995 [Algoriphagus sp. AGSA1]|uniref:hypothetical protein n=1 Tax=Algoriphagus sp. AGSA1 TaxID=2907213 RepID=UPI001F2109C7|nr:hypothetical protein [Algoriphagus sp. AGSA1]MCE7053630.1 hypothetical protein [Algoriphagus sp. AGSA1]
MHNENTSTILGFVEVFFSIAYGLLKKSQVCQFQGGRVKMHAYTSNEANIEDDMPETSSKISILRFSDAWIKAYPTQ